MANLTVNGVRIEYESAGDPKHPAIVLIMGLGMQLTGWPDSLVDALVAGGYRVVRFDNRDAGLSSRVRGRFAMGPVLAILAARLHLPLRPAYRLEDMAKDTLALMDALGIPRAHVVGVSMGGMIAQVLATRAPERVLSLTSIMSTTGNRRASRPRPEALRALMKRVPASAPRAEAIRQVVRVFTVIGSPGYPTEPAVLEARVSAWVNRAYDPAATGRQLVAVMAAGDRRRELRGLKVPTLVIHGADDPLIPVEAGRDTARVVPGATLKVIDGMGHDLPEALMPTIAEAIIAHCRSVEAPARA